MKKQEIIVACGTDIIQMAAALCKMADLSALIRMSCGKRQPRIALKPNLLGPIPASEGATTHPQAAEGVISYLREQGFEDIVMMESSWVGDRTEDSLLVTGFGALCERLNVPFFDLQKDSAVTVDCAGMMLKICRKALEADFLINLPVAKGHCQTGMTCALKNLKGCIPASEKRRFHRMGLHEPIGHLSAGLKQGFILADAICPDLMFEDGGNPVPLNRLVCAVDPVLLDAYVCGKLGLDPAQVPYIRIAEECGAGSSDLLAASVTMLREDWQNKAARYLEEADSVDTWRNEADCALSVKEMVSDVDSCSACYGTLIPVLHKLEAEGLSFAPGEKLCIGQGWRGMSGAIGIGTCTSGFACSLPGCPPDAAAMERFLRERMASSDQRRGCATT